ncbi:hypothetical protein [Gilvibacter sediminis]|uniref:hypothetical protein n=1 Tax=Gilvibacter sediminis TaxID=379071 RepID=UPI00235020D9|nr:hypothetical protein [Gilvibacter sediminis]MDC7997991.1 hypothetical protein [Gilvibacter sediminis]
MILTEGQIDERTIKKIVGEPVSFDFNKPKIVGSPLLYLKRFNSQKESAKTIKENSRCNLEIRSNGLILHTNILNKRTLLLIPKKENTYLKIIKGSEKIDPFFLSPMWWLLKFGVSVRVARNFKIMTHEYSIDEMKLVLKTEDHELEFTASGYLFERHLDFLKKLEYAYDIEVV